MADCKNCLSVSARSAAMRQTYAPIFLSHAPGPMRRTSRPRFRSYAPGVRSTAYSCTLSSVLGDVMRITYNKMSVGHKNVAKSRVFQTCLPNCLPNRWFFNIFGDM